MYKNRFCAKQSVSLIPICETEGDGVRWEVGLYIAVFFDEVGCVAVGVLGRGEGAGSLLPHGFVRGDEGGRLAGVPSTPCPLLFLHLKNSQYKLNTLQHG